MYRIPPRAAYALAFVLTLLMSDLRTAPTALGAQDAASADSTQPAETKGSPEAASEHSLDNEQAALRMRYVRFEETLAKMARYLQKTEPARAELILRALTRSKAERLGERMLRTSRLLADGEEGGPQFADAIAEQEAILAELKNVLNILRSEDILDENKREQERLKEIARKINVLIDAEKIHRAQTDRGRPAEPIAEDQRQTAERTDKLISGIEQHDAKGESEGRREGETGRGGGKGDEKSGEKKEKAGDTSKENRESEKDNEKSGKSGDSSEGAPQDDSQKSENSEQQGGQKGKSKGSQKQSSKGGQRSGQKANPSKSSNGQKSPAGQNSPPSQQGQQQQQTPGRQELEDAHQRMEQAIEQLQKEQRQNASEEQAEAIQKLIEAKERIEEKLRQLREEERELLLRALEARFQKMHQLQQIVLDATEQLHETGRDNWQDRDYANCRDAAATEREIGIEADKVLEILRADGSSVAFPVAVSQIRSDIAEVARRLGEEDAGRLTIVIEQDILAALQEMIVALQKEMQEIRDKKKQQQQSGQKSQQGQRGLVDAIAELKMLKTLQLRVNRRTSVLGELFKGEQATKPDVISQLQELAKRQAALQRATYDLSIGKTD